MNLKMKTYLEIDRFKRTALCLASLAVAAMLLFLQSSASASDKTIKLSLQDAIKMAGESNPGLSASRSETAAAEARIGMAAAAKKPSLSTTSFVSDGDMGGILQAFGNVMPAALNNYQPKRYYDQNVMLMVPLDVSGRLKKNVNGAEIRHKAAKGESEKFRQDLMMDVRIAYYEALYRKELAGVFKSAVEVAATQLKNDEVAVKAGRFPAYYLDRDRAELAMQSQQFAEAEKDAELANLKLAELLGASPETAIELTDELKPPDAWSAPEFDERAQPDIAAAGAGRDAAGVSLDTARRAFRPEAAITLMSDRAYLQDDDVMNGTTVALVIAFPLYDGGMRRSAIQEAGAMKDVAEKQLHGEKLRVAYAYESMRLEMDTAVKNISTADEALKAAEENARVAGMRYEAGKGILVEVLDANNSVIRANAGRLKAVRDAIVARDILLRLAGKL